MALGANKWNLRALSWFRHGQVHSWYEWNGKNVLSWLILHQKNKQMFTNYLPGCKALQITARKIPVETCSYRYTGVRYPGAWYRIYTSVSRVMIGLANNLSPGRYQAITRISIIVAELLSNSPMASYFNVISFEIQIFPSTKVHLTSSSAKDLGINMFS